jgi:hypothetical protein
VWQDQYRGQIRIVGRSTDVNFIFEGSAGMRDLARKAIPDPLNRGRFLYVESSMAAFSEFTICDSITQLAAHDRGRVVVSGSHGGLYAAYVAARDGVRAVILNDAGRGLDDAGIAGLGYLDELDIPAATVGHETAQIGDGADMMRRGTLTHVNAAAVALGCRVGQGCAEAARLLLAAPAKEISPPKYEESRFLLRDGPIKVWGLDSAALVGPDDAGHVVVTGSHGALLGGKPDYAVRAAVLAALFHDAGIGIDGAGTTRLPALDIRGIAGATVAAATARIGDSRSLWETGRLSVVNDHARAAGITVGMSVPQFAETIIAHAGRTNR